MESDFQKQKIIDLFKSLSGTYWLTIDQIVENTKLQYSDVSRILTNSGYFVRSSYRSSNGEPVYTTRDLFRANAPFMDKIIGAFKNRID
jgi:hypothetical protein